MTMGQRIAERRKMLGISQESLGDKLGVSRQAISKWEADGAIPEIDKLIALSKLFGVTVGWLLGTEEVPGAASEGISEEQMKTIEELILRYSQPKQEPKNAGRKFKVLAVAGIAVAIVMAAVALEEAGNVPNYSGQLFDLSADYNDLQNQLYEMSDQLEELAQGEKLLTEYEVTAKATGDFTAAEVSFQAFPRHWQEGDTGIFVVRLAGEEMTRAECTFNGSSCEAAVRLQPADEYSYCFIQLHADGSQEQQLLEYVDHYSMYVAEGLRIHWDVTVASEAAQQKLDITNCHALLRPPTLLQETEGLTWSSARMTFYLNGQQLKAYDLLSKNMYGTSEELYLEASFWIEGLSVSFAPGDRLTAVVNAELSNGIALEDEVAAWYLEGDHITQEVKTDKR